MSKGRGATCNAPVWLVKEPSGKWQLTIDYRALNECAIGRANVAAVYPEMIATVKLFMNWFSVLDVTNGYWSIPLTEERQYQTAFT